MSSCVLETGEVVRSQGTCVRGAGDSVTCVVGSYISNEVGDILTMTRPSHQPMSSPLHLLVLLLILLLCILLLSKILDHLGTNIL